MTVHGILISLDVVIIAAIVVKGFWSGDRVKPTEQPDDWQSNTGDGS